MKNELYYTEIIVEGTRGNSHLPREFSETSDAAIALCQRAANEYKEDLKVARVIRRRPEPETEVWLRPALGSTVC